ncbi:MAG: DUF4832 domain-containing protein [Flavitalea sp.]
MSLNKWLRIFASVVILLFVASCSRSQVGNNNGPKKDVQYEESNEIFPNPERGFIHNMDVSSEGPGLETSDLATLKGENVSMILRLFYLEKFKDKLISDAELELIRSDFQKLRDAGIKCVLRFAYTNDMTVADAPFSIITQHLDQLKPLLEENKDIIAFVQAGFIGAWGEWHSSSNGLATTENERKVLEKLLSVLPSSIMVQVRTPGEKKDIFGTANPVDSLIAYSSEARSRVGHHNDCFMASADDYGTYSNVQADKEYISKEGLFVPTGGETCPPDPPSSTPGCPQATSTMKLLRWTYLNLDWYKPIIDAWKVAGCFDELQRNLGYRLILQTTSLPEKIALNASVAINIKLTNKGYAPLYNLKVTRLVLKNKSNGQVHELQLAVDLRKCKPLGELVIQETISASGIEQGLYDVYLKISDNSEALKNRSEYSVRLANSNVWAEENGGMNKLNHQLQIGD